MIKIVYFYNISFSLEDVFQAPRVFEGVEVNQMLFLWSKKRGKEGY